MVRNRALATLLSQTLVAFTVEVDNECERRMGEAGFRGARISLVLWLNLIRHISSSGSLVQDLAASGAGSKEALKLQLGCLERWGFLTLAPGSTEAASPRDAAGRAGRGREGWGSGRGIRNSWAVRLSGKGLKAAEIWPDALEKVEGRWIARLGKQRMARFRKSAQAVIDALALDLPWGLPPTLIGRTEAFPARSTAAPKDLALPCLLSQLLLGFAIEFDRESPAPITMSANTLRVLGEAPIPVRDIALLTGSSPERTNIGWQLKPYVTVETAPGVRGKVAKLTAAGLKAQQAYGRLVTEIERRWAERFGTEVVHDLREFLSALFRAEDANQPPIALGLTPPPGTVRAGDLAPALGRRDVGAAARQRMRDLVAQTEAFLRDPIDTLPYYPLWDMNRGFGP
ncbi:MAG TPA: hypothetical protein VMF91_12575 [Bryobacteraceae bacterium]|nr:hypothetical protein [Bryobacteraceae bacterium]